MEQLAVIRNAHLEVEDHCGEVCIFFDAYLTESVASLQVIRWNDAQRMLQRCRQVSDLNGKACWVETDGNISRFKRMFEG